MNHVPVEPDEALRRLLDGNRRYVYSNAGHPNQSAVYRLLIAREPQPFAVILGCADARVPPEIVFDQGLGDLFVVRVAGNVIDDFVLGSLEYAVERYHAPLLVVLGHEHCGAVMAALADDAGTGHIAKVLAALQPAVAIARRQTGDPLDNAIVANVKAVMSQVSAAEPLIAARVRSGDLRVVGARYAVNTGMVDLVT